MPIAPSIDLDTTYLLRNLIILIGFFGGVGMGIFLIVRKRMLPGLLTIAAFLLFCLEPLTDFIVFRLLWNQEFSDQAWQTIEFVYPCLTAPAFFLGSLALIAALYLMLKPAPPSPEQNIYPG